MCASMKHAIRKYSLDYVSYTKRQAAHIEELATEQQNEYDDFLDDSFGDGEGRNFWDTATAKCGLKQVDFSTDKY